MDSVINVPGRSLEYASLLLRLCWWLNINHDITWFVESPFCSYTFNEARVGCNWYSSSFFFYLCKSGLAVQRKWWLILYREFFFFRLISATSKAKEGQVAILVYGRRCALVHGSVNKSCKNRRPDSSRDTLIPLTDSSILEKEKKKNLPWHHERTQWKFKEGFCLEESLLILWLHKPKKAQRFAKAEKTREKKITGGSRGVELGSGSQGQETNRVCQHCEVREINKRWQIRQSSCCVEGKD